MYYFNYYIEVAVQGSSLGIKFSIISHAYPEHLKMI